MFRVMRVNRAGMSYPYPSGTVSDINNLRFGSYQEAEVYALQHANSLTDAQRYIIVEERAEVIKQVITTTTYPIVRI